MSNFVNTVDSIGDEALTNSIIDKSITEILDNYVTVIGVNAFAKCSSLTTVDLPAATSIGASAFYGCSALITVDFPVAQNIGAGAFQNCSSLTTVSLPAMTIISNSAFYECSKLTTVNLPVAHTINSNVFSYCTELTTVDFPAATSIGGYAFQNCSKLTALILRSETMANLGGTNTFTNTPIASGTGYIYVPSALVDTYKAANKWSTYAGQIRAIEDYPEICGQ